MPIFIIHRKTGKPIEMDALSYTEDEEKDRIYFHRTADQTDKDRFCVRSAVAGVDKTEPFEPGDVALERFLDSPNSEGYLKDMLRLIQERKQRKETDTKA
jgi:hypothetical protein